MEVITSTNSKRWKEGCCRRRCGIGDTFLIKAFNKSFLLLQAFTFYLICFPFPSMASPLSTQVSSTPPSTHSLNKCVLSPCRVRLHDSEVPGNKAAAHPGEPCPALAPSLPPVSVQGSARVPHPRNMGKGQQERPVG